MAVEILLGVFVSSIPLLIAILMLRMWNKEKPILKREKQG
tara:strand:- start:13 stop:132 length:120 start_codon:yes stop_codon:yes gene_type:complete